MFGKIREKFTFYLSTFFLLNASAFTGYALSQTEVEEIVVTARSRLIRRFGRLPPVRTKVEGDIQR
jgi:hypothetical protein